jgi:hypothetical protein
MFVGLFADLALPTCVAHEEELVRTYGSGEVGTIIEGTVDGEDDMEAYGHCQYGGRWVVSEHN